MRLIRLGKEEDKEKSKEEEEEQSCIREGGEGQIKRGRRSTVDEKKKEKVR